MDTFALIDSYIPYTRSARRPPCGRPAGPSLSARPPGLLGPEKRPIIVISYWYSYYHPNSH